MMCEVENPVMDDKKLKQLESVKRAKAKYYQKKKQDTEFVEMMREKAKTYYTAKKDDPEYKEQQRIYAKKYHEMNRERTNEYYQNYYHNKKLKQVIQKLEILGIEKIAELIIAHKKVKIFDVSDE